MTGRSVAGDAGNLDSDFATGENAFLGAALLVGEKPVEGRPLNPEGAAGENPDFDDETTTLGLITFPALPKPELGPLVGGWLASGFVTDGFAVDADDALEKPLGLAFKRELNPESEVTAVLIAGFLMANPTPPATELSSATVSESVSASATRS